MYDNVKHCAWYVLILFIYLGIWETMREWCHALTMLFVSKAITSTQTYAAQTPEHMHINFIIMRKHGKQIAFKFAASKTICLRSKQDVAKAAKTMNMDEDSAAIHMYI